MDSLHMANLRRAGDRLAEFHHYAMSEACRRAGFRITELEAELAAERGRREAAEELLRGACCPRPANRAPDDTTVAECIRRDECGCIYGGHFARYKD